MLEQQEALPFISNEEDEDLIQKGKVEQEAMSRHQSKLQPPNKGRMMGGGGGGFGSAKDTSKKKQQAQQAQMYAQVLQEEGLVRIDNVLSAKLTKQLKEYLVDLRARSTQLVHSNEVALEERFADVLHNKNRCDLKVPLGPAPVMEALNHIMSKTVLPQVIEQVFDDEPYNKGMDATLWELNCFMSNTGSRRQLVHPDQSCETSLREPVMLTIFVALQNTDPTMGPTNFIPNSHTPQQHVEFYKDKTQYLSQTPNVLGTLSSGSCVLFDPRVLHCATANDCADPNLTRAMFYFSFKNPKIDNPGCPSCGGYGIPKAELTLEELTQELKTSKKKRKQNDDDTPRAGRLEELSCFP